MAETTTIPTIDAGIRPEKGSQVARRLRLKGLVPAELYGHHQDNVHLSVRLDEISKLLSHGVQLVSLNFDGKSERALIKDVQHNYLGDGLMHVDFARVALDEKVKVNVAIDFHGTPVGLAHGGVVEYHITEMEVECLPMAIPESIRVNVDNLDINQFIHARDIVVPEGVKVLEDPEAIIAAVHVAKAAPTEVLGAEVVSEPEVIGEKKKEEEEE